MIGVVSEIDRVTTMCVCEERDHRTYGAGWGERPSTSVRLSETASEREKVSERNNESEIETARARWCERRVMSKRDNACLSVRVMTSETSSE